jgi:hypothetical protein
VANISDSMSRMFAGGPLLRPMHSGGHLAGPAFTVRTRPGDNLMIHKAFDIESLILATGSPLVLLTRAWLTLRRRFRMRKPIVIRTSLCV